MRILGIDPGLATVGLGLIDAPSPQEWHALDWLTITTEKGLPLAERLREIAADLSTFLDEAQPELAVVEKLFFATNALTAIDVAQARGTILMTLAGRQIPIIEPTPLQLKSAVTGDGKADKQQIQLMLCRMLHLDECPHPDDAADALALAVYGALHANQLTPQ